MRVRARWLEPLPSGRRPPTRLWRLPPTRWRRSPTAAARHARSMVVGERTALCTHALFDRPPIASGLGRLLVVERPHHDRARQDPPHAARSNRSRPATRCIRAGRRSSKTIADSSSPRTTSSSSRRRRGDSFAVWTRRCPGKSRPRNARRAGASSPAGNTSRPSSIRLPRSDSSLNAHISGASDRAIGHVDRSCP